MQSTKYLPVLIAAALVAGGCSSTGRSSNSQTWLDPMLSGSPIYTGVSPSAAESSRVLSSARVCCDSLSEASFETLNTEDTEFYKLGADTPAFRFATGKSLFRAFKLPDSLKRATVRIDAVAAATVFVPTVLVLDRDFQVSRAIDSANFKYVPAGFMEPQRLSANLDFDRRSGGELANEKYFVVFTTDEDLAGSTQMISEARLHARSRGLADPGLPDPVAKHAATGVFRMSVSDLEERVISNRQYVEQERDAARYVAPAAVAAPRSEPAPTPKPAPKPAPTRPAATPAPPVAPSAAAPQPMMAETQAIYDDMIRDSVRAGQMDRAWRLVQEAERAGSKSARKTFLNAVETR